MLTLGIWITGPRHTGSERWWVVPWVGVGVVVGVAGLAVSVGSCWVPGGVVVLVFDGSGGEGVPDQDGGEEFFDVAGWSGFGVGEGGGWGDEVVEVVGGVGADGVHPQLWWGGLPAVFGVVVAGGAGEVQHGAVGVGVDLPFGVVLEKVVTFAVGVDVFWGGSEQQRDNRQFEANVLQGGMVSARGLWLSAKSTA